MAKKSKNPPIEPSKPIIDPPSIVDGKWLRVWDDDRDSPSLIAIHAIDCIHQYDGLNNEPGARIEYRSGSVDTVSGSAEAIIKLIAESGFYEALDRALKG